MGRPRKMEVSDTYRAMSPEAREQQMISYAENLAEQKLRDGTASSQIIVHYLQLGSEKARIEREILEQKRELMHAQTESIKSEKRTEEVYKKVLTALKRYNGDESNELEDIY